MRQCLRSSSSLSHSCTSSNTSPPFRNGQEAPAGPSWRLAPRRELGEHWKSLWYKNKRLPEKYAQRLFFAVAYNYCKVNNLDITLEADSGTGPVDFKLSTGFDSRVLVEVKLSSNGKLVAGYQKQLESYKAAEETRDLSSARCRRHGSEGRRPSKAAKQCG